MAVCSYNKLKCLLFLTLNIGFLVVSIFLWLSETSVYGEVISYEMDEWNKGHVSDIIAQDTLPCAENYTMLES